MEGHPNIIRFLGIYQGLTLSNIRHNVFQYIVIKLAAYSQIFNITGLSSHYNMVFEYADGGTLSKYLQRYFYKLTWEDKYRLALGITDGLLCLHKLDIVHKNLVCMC